MTSTFVGPMPACLRTGRDSRGSNHNFHEGFPREGFQALLDLCQAFLFGSRPAVLLGCALTCKEYGTQCVRRMSDGFSRPSVTEESWTVPSAGSAWPGQRLSGGPCPRVK